VEVDGKVVSAIGPGLLCLIGLGQGDTAEDQDYLIRKVLNGRLWPNEEKGNKPWDLSVSQKGYELLLVSQFTLFCKFKGNKPDFHLAMPPAEARETYQAFVEKVKATYQPDKVKDGVFGAMMQVSLVNDGPVTVTLDTKDK
jgi:D-tyrosyl-tRNA(Tyr) deacylase